MRLLLGGAAALCGVLASPAAHACTYAPVTVIGEDGEPTGQEYAPQPLPAPAARLKASIPEGLQGEVVVMLPELSLAVVSRDPCIENRWPWASVTKQVAATIVMRKVEHGTLALDIAVKDKTVEFGELWQRSGISYDLLSALACGGDA